MTITQERRQTILKQVISGTVAHAITAFLIDRRAANLNPRTVTGYQSELRLFSEYLDHQGVITLEELSPDVIRLYLVSLGERRNGGGQHAAYRVIRAWLRFAWEEYDLQTRNPIERVKPPKRNTQARPGVEVSDVQKLIDACAGDKLAARDKAIFAALLDSGARAAEVCAWTVGDYDPVSGRLMIQHGKGDKRRAVFVGKTTRRAIAAYLRGRADLEADEPLFATQTGDFFTHAGLRHLVVRRAEAAGIEAPGLHDFRRAFAINMLRAGTDLVTLAELMGHSDLQVLKRYLALIEDDLQAAHASGSPVDRMSKTTKKGGRK